MVVGCNNYSDNVINVCYRHLLVGAPERCKLWLLAIGHPDVNVPWDALQQNNSILRVCSNHFLDSDGCGRKDSITQEN